MKIPPKRHLQIFSFFILFILLNLYLSIILISSLRRERILSIRKRNFEVKKLNSVKPGINPVVLISREIESGIRNQKYNDLVNLLGSVPLNSIYNIKLLSESVFWNIEASEIFFKSGHLNVNRNCILHSIVKKLQDNNPVHLEYLDYLLKGGADVNLPDSTGNPPFFYILQRGNDKLINLFLGHGVFVNTPFAKYDSALHFAVEINLSNKIICSLINYGGNPFHRGKDGLTPFHRAILKRNEKIIMAFIQTVPLTFEDNPPLYNQLLLNYPTSPFPVPFSSSQTLYGYTPLHLGVSKDYNSSLVELLISNGADINLKNNNGQTALQLAQTIYHFDIINSITKYQKST